MVFNFLKKKQVENTRKVEKYIFSDDLDRRAICSNALFKNPSVFLNMKLTNENRDEFLEKNYFNMLYSSSPELSWDKQIIPGLKEALQIGYDIVDKSSYEVTFGKFADGGLTHAWDIVRMVGITQDAYTTGYIDLSLAKEKINILGKKISENYSSWEELVSDFIMGKLDFNEWKELEGKNTEIFADSEDILVMVDFLFNDKDTPLKKVLFYKDENLVESGENILRHILSISERTRKMMKVYKKVYGWEPFILIDGNMDNEREKNTYRFVKEELEFETSEEIIFIHSYTHKRPEKSEIQLILTNQRIISFLAKEKKYIYIPLEEIHENSIDIRGYGRELFINGDKMLECFCINSEEEISSYLEIVYDLVVFLRNKKN